MRTFQPDYLLFTKLDETGSQGAILSAALEAGKPLSFFTNGQNIPEDIEPAQRARVACIGVPSGNGGGRLGGIDGFQYISERGLLRFPPRRSTPAERDRLILENLPHVRWVAMRIHEKIGGAVSLEDLVSSRRHRTHQCRG